MADVSGRVGDEGMMQVGVFLLKKLQYVLTIIVRRLLVDDDDFEFGIILFEDGREVLL